MRDVHVVYEADGRILAIADASPARGEDGALLSSEPVPTPGQFCARLTLTDEHLAAGPVAVLRDFEVDIASEVPALRRR